MQRRTRASPVTTNVIGIDQSFSISSKYLYHLKPKWQFRKVEAGEVYVTHLRRIITRYIEVPNASHMGCQYCFLAINSSDPTSISVREFCSIRHCAAADIDRLTGDELLGPRPWTRSWDVWRASPVFRDSICFKIMGNVSYKCFGCYHQDRHALSETL